MTKPDEKLKNDEFVPSSSFCWNEKCADYGQLDAGNLRNFGFTRKGRQRWQCTTCQKAVAET
jgi:transposase-like protein